MYPNPQPPTGPNARSFVITGNQELDGLILKGIAAGAVWLATLASEHLKISDPNFVSYLTTTIAGAGVTLAVAAWGVLNVRFHRAKDVQAGITLAMTGKALFQGTGDGKVTPIPVTPTTAKEIVDNFADVPVKLEPKITDDLNAAQVKIAQGNGQ